MPCKKICGGTQYIKRGSVIDVITSVEDMQREADRIRCSGKTIAFIPTMGFLHDGHLSLIREGRSRADTLVVSIFVNPTQFGPGEDFQTYPRDFDRDFERIKAEKVDVLFYPDAGDLYPEGFQTYVSLETLPNHLCGLSRPVFFRGVATVVTKLFHVVKPHFAVFGEKDYQQLMVIRRMVKDLNLDIQIVGCPTVREPDGLAMSSRNAYLSPSQRAAALSLVQALNEAKASVAAGARNAAQVVDSAAQCITAHPDTEIDYITICDPDTLVELDVIKRPVLMALAVKVGKTRLIDNARLTP